MPEDIDTPQRFASLFHAYSYVAHNYPDEIVIEQALFGSSPRSTRQITNRELLLSILKLRNFLASHDIKQSDLCAICSNTCPEWLIADMAILSLGAINVSIYTSLPTHDIAYIMRDSGAKIAIVENEKLVQQFIDIHQGFVGSDGQHYEAYQLKNIISINVCKPHPLVTQLETILNTDYINPSLQVNCPASQSTIAALVYTSGSTGKPKGVIQTHGNHLANIEQVKKANIFGPSGSLFLYLPLAHSFARLVGYLGLLTDTKLQMPAISDPVSGTLDLVSISQDLRAANCEYLPSIPRLFEKIKMNIERKATEKNVQGWILRKTLNSAKAMYKSQRLHSDIGLLDWFFYHITESVRSKLRLVVFGNNLKHAISGGAKLSPDVAEFFATLDVKILQGYGLTETCVATNVNRPDDNRIGTVGPVFDGIEMKITPEGEICFRGANVTQGYWNNQEATNEAWDSDGWFHTGDLGTVDSDGYLTITGRKKEIIVSAGGKKIPPQKIEKLLESIPEISHAILYGNDRPFCVALLTLNPDYSYNKDNNNPQNIPELWRKIEIINEQLAPFEKIRKARIVNEELTVENGTLTPTQKIKRHAIRERYKDLIWEMYNNVPHPGAVPPIDQPKE
jgi:long-chain acyl-CoA synthetase